MTLRKIIASSMLASASQVGAHTRLRGVDLMRPDFMQLVGQLAQQAEHKGFLKESTNQYNHQECDNLNNNYADEQREALVQQQQFEERSRRRHREELVDTFGNGNVKTAKQTLETAITDSKLIEIAYSCEDKVREKLFRDVNFEGARKQVKTLLGEGVVEFFSVKGLPVVMHKNTANEVTVAVSGMRESELIEIIESDATCKDLANMAKNFMPQISASSSNTIRRELVNLLLREGAHMTKIEKSNSNNEIFANKAITTIAKALLTQINAFAPVRTSLHVTGHSAGGQVANVLAVLEDINKKGEIAITKNSFSVPATGNDEFMHFVERNFSRNIAREGDQIALADANLKKMGSMTDLMSLFSGNNTNNPQKKKVEPSQFFRAIDIASGIRAVDGNPILLEGSDEFSRRMGGDHGIEAVRASLEQAVNDLRAEC